MSKSVVYAVELQSCNFQALKKVDSNFLEWLVSAAASDRKDFVIVLFLPAEPAAPRQDPSTDNAAYRKALNRFLSGEEFKRRGKAIEFIKTFGIAIRGNPQNAALTGIVPVSGSAAYLSAMLEHPRTVNLIQKISERESSVRPQTETSP